MYKSEITRNANIKSIESINPQRWTQIIVASLLFILGNLIDYILTVYGISNRLYEEGNPIIQGYIDYFGLEKGLLLFKALMGGLIISGVIVFDKACKEKGMDFRSERVLYIGAIATMAAGLLWLNRSIELWNI